MQLNTMEVDESMSMQPQIDAFQSPIVCCMYLETRPGFSVTLIEIHTRRVFLSATALRTCSASRIRPMRKWYLQVQATNASLPCSPNRPIIYILFFAWPE